MEMEKTRDKRKMKITQKFSKRRKWRAFLWLPKMPPGVDAGAGVVESGKPTIVVFFMGKEK